MQYRLDFVEDDEKDVDDLKYCLAGYIRVYGREPDIAQRLIDDELLETDLFFLRGFCAKMPGINEKEYVISPS